MLSRKQQWRRTRVRRAPSSKTAVSNSSSLAKQGEGEGHERADSDQTTALSTWSSFDSLRDEDRLRDAVPLARPAPTAERSVSFQQEVQVFLVTHELDTSAKQALWWTGRDAAMNKRAWLNHLGQPGCGRQSAGRPRPPPNQQQQHQHQQYRHHQPPQHQHQHQQHDRSSHFLGAGRNTAAGRGRGGGVLLAHSFSSSSRSSNNMGVGFMGEAAAAAVDATEALPADGVGILGCRCDACLAEGDDQELDYEPQERLRRRGWQQQQQEREQQLPPRYDKPPPPYNDQPPPRYTEVYSRPTGKVPQQYRGAHPRGGAARGASKSWPSPEDWDREDDLGGKGSRSYSPGSASGSSPLHEACEAYDDEGSYFFDS